MMYHEITGSSLVKVDIAGRMKKNLTYFCIYIFVSLGNIIDPGSTTYGINRAGYTLHSAIHKARPDIKCIIHLLYNNTDLLINIILLKQKEFFLKNRRFY